MFKILDARGQADRAASYLEHAARALTVAFHLSCENPRLVRLHVKRAIEDLEAAARAVQEAGVLAAGAQAEAEEEEGGTEGGAGDKTGPAPGI